MLIKVNRENDENNTFYNLSPYQELQDLVGPSGGPERHYWFFTAHKSLFKLPAQPLIAEHLTK